MKNEIDAGKVIEAMRAYIYFICDNQPKGNDEVAAFDSRRRALHNELAKSLGFNPELAYSNWPGFDDSAEMVGNWNKCFDTLDEFITYQSYRLIDKVSDNSYRGIKTQYALKDRIDKWVDTLEESIGKRRKPVDKIMLEAQNNYDAWYNNEVEKGNAEWVSPKVNTHDYGKWTGVINAQMEIIRKFAGLPREAYLDVAVDEYYNKPIGRIKTALATLEMLAFQTEHSVYPKEPYYRYLDKDAKNEH